MITEAGWIIIINVICATVITVVTLITRQDVNSLRPGIEDVRAQLAAANAFILKQGNEKQALMDELANRKPTMTPEEFDETYKASPPYRKPPGKN